MKAIKASVNGVEKIISEFKTGSTKGKDFEAFQKAGKKGLWFVKPQNQENFIPMNNKQFAVFEKRLSESGSGLLKIQTFEDGATLVNRYQGGLLVKTELKHSPETTSSSLQSTDGLNTTDAGEELTYVRAMK